MVRVQPTAQQEWLLEAVLLEDGEAAAAWRRWSAGADFDRLDAGSWRLLPLLYPRLAALHADPATTERLRTEYSGTWRANQLRLHELQQVVNRLQGAGIPVLLLKGAALLVAYYGDPGLRPMADCDLLVPYAMAPQALDVLSGSAWKAYGAAPHAQALTHANGLDLDLHWNVFADLGGPTVDEPLWQAAVPAALADTSVLVLCPADQLLHVCVHAALWSQTPGIRWIADAAVLVRAEPGIDWDRLIAQAQRCRMTLATRTMLRYLRERFHVAIPDGVLRRIEATEISRSERVHFARQAVPVDSRPVMFETWMVCAYYVRWARARRRRLSPAGFVRYLAARYLLDTAWELPRYAVSRLARHDWRPMRER
jgi:hypothetical protein